ncbi:PREDICTED: odorant receptor 13a-like [Ceratosolen solmsi marchali]|uniref:Odorant receptor n=1 Tax=Ceratosolen solmsi marchali TaxID=326594 RepID=A0AAJ6YNX1_9HYME|nr:PREDICTED: odorant receptor 13a-like [Ceratosolen solmsi marchali]
MMEYEVKKYEKYKNNIKFLLIGSGLWPDYQKHPKNLKNFLSICSAVSSGCTTYGIIAFCISNISNINILTRGLGLMISFASACLKVCILALRKNDLLSLNKGISAHFEKDLQIPKFRPYLLAHFSEFSKFFYIFDYSVALNLTMLMLTPMLMLRHGKYVRALPQLIPFNYELGGAVHWSIYVFEILSAYYCWSITVGVDSVFGLYAMHMVGELRLLSARFESLISSKNYRKDLKECIDRHILIIDSQHLMQRIFGFLAIWLAVTCAVVMCAIIFQATGIQNMTVYRAIYLICYCFLKLVQAYTYAWFGNIIAVESEICLNSIYNAHWPETGDLRFMNDILIIQSQNPLRFIASGCVIVRLDMFSKILHASISYFFLLRTLDGNVQDS